MTPAFVDPHAPRRPPRFSPGFRTRQALQRLVAFIAPAAELASLAIFVAGLLALLYALAHP
jgi:hypothetical protein